VKLHVLNASHQDKTVKALEQAAAKASPTARRTIQALAESLKTNPTNTPGTGRASAKGKTMAKKKTARRTRRATTRKTNPTPRATRRRYRRNPTASASGFKRAVAGIDLQGILMEGASIVGGELAQSFIQKQVTSFLPSLTGTPASLASAAVVAGASLYFGKGKGMLRGVAIGAIAAGVRGIAKGVAPSLFAGADDLAPTMGALPDGYTDPTTGEWVPFAGADDVIEGAEAEDVAGTLYNMPSSVATYPRARF